MSVVVGVARLCSDTIDFVVATLKCVFILPIWILYTSCLPFCYCAERTRTRTYKGTYNGTYKGTYKDSVVGESKDSDSDDSDDSDDDEYVTAREFTRLRFW